MGPACPICKTRIPFRRTQMDLGKTFNCDGCEQKLVVPRGQNWLFILGLLVLFWVVKDRFITHWIGVVGLWLGIATLGLPALYLKTQVRLAVASDTQKPPRP